MNSIQLEEEQLCRDLAKAGMKVESVYDLVNSKTDYSAAIPVLLKWLPKAKTESIREGIVRALTLKDAGEEVFRALITQFETMEVTNKKQENIKWAIGNAIAEVATSTMIEKLHELVLTKKHGNARQMIVVTLGKKGKKRRRRETIDVLLKLLDDPDVQGHAIVSLGYLKAKEARSSIEPFLKHKSTWIRQEANRTLSKIKGDDGK